MPTVFKPYKQESRKDWGAHQEAELTTDQIKIGALLRIADASEAMAKNHAALQDEAARYKRWYNEEHANSGKLMLSNAALRGQITKLRKKLAALQAAKDP